MNAKLSSRIDMAGDGIVVKGAAYGIQSMRVDGNDALAVYNAVRAARQMAVLEQRPILLEVHFQIPHFHFSLLRIMILVSNTK